MASTTMATMAVLNAKCMGLKSPSSPSKPMSLLSLPKPKISTGPISGPSSVAGAAIAGAIFSTLSSVDPAMAAQQIAEIAEGDNRGLALLLPIVPAIGWVLYNILQPALNQLNRMRNEKGLIVGLGLGGLGLLMSAQEAQASEIARIAEAAGSDNRGQLLLIVILPAIGWVLYNILQPALNQLNRMRSQ